MAAANLAELPAWALDLLERSPLAHLSYLDDGARPRVLPVTFAIVAEDLWTAIDQKPKRNPADEIARVRYLRRRPQAALCADHYEDDWSRLAWVQVMASVKVLGAGDGAVQGALASLRAKYDHYVNDPPDGPFLRLRPERVLCWRASED
jgi:PPOX class probable F420-dependent enzyme